MISTSPFPSANRSRRAPPRALFVAAAFAIALGATSARAQDPAQQPVDDPASPRLVLTTSIMGFDAAYSPPAGTPGDAWSIGTRADIDARIRYGFLNARMRVDLGIGGGSQLTGWFGLGGLVGVGIPLSPGQYLFARAGAEGFYRQRPRGMLAIIEAPKIEIGYGAAPVSLRGSTLFKKMAVELSGSSGLALGTWAGDDGDRRLRRSEQAFSPSFGAGLDVTVLPASLRAEVLHVQNSESLTVVRVRPCFAVIYLGACLDAEVAQGHYPSMAGPAVARTNVTLGVLLGFGIAWFEPQVPRELPVQSPGAIARH